MEGSKLCGDRTLVYSFLFIALFYYIIFHYSKRLDNVFFSEKQVSKSEISGEVISSTTPEISSTTSSSLYKDDFILKLVKQQAAKAEIKNSETQRRLKKQYLHENAPIILANSLGWDDRKMHGPPNGLETCPEKYQNRRVIKT